MKAHLRSGRDAIPTSCVHKTRDRTDFLSKQLYIQRLDTHYPIKAVYWTQSQWIRKGSSLGKNSYQRSPSLTSNQTWLLEREWKPPFNNTTRWTPPATFKLIAHTEDLSLTAKRSLRKATSILEKTIAIIAGSDKERGARVKTTTSSIAWIQGLTSKTETRATTQRKRSLKKNRSLLTAFLIVINVASQLRKRS